MEKIEVKKLKVLSKNFWKYCNEAYIWDDNKTWYSGSRFLSDVSAFFQVSVGLFYNDEYIGYGTISKKNKKTASISTIIKGSYRNKGLGKLFYKELVKIAFEDLKYKFVGSEILSDNIPSIKMVESIGLKYTGKAKKGNYYMININEYNDWLSKNK